MRALGAAIPRAINLCLQFQREHHNVLDLDVSTNTVDLVGKRSMKFNTVCSVLFSFNHDAFSLIKSTDMVRIEENPEFRIVSSCVNSGPKKLN